jgi:hypothetical protein
VLPQVFVLGNTSYEGCGETLHDRDILTHKGKSSILKTLNSPDYRDASTKYSWLNPA